MPQNKNYCLRVGGKTGCPKASLARFLPIRSDRQAHLGLHPVTLHGQIHPSIKAPKRRL
jgi:hypothetical protein